MARRDSVKATAGKTRITAAALVAVLGLWVGPVLAETGNLLQNPGAEGVAGDVNAHWEYGFNFANVTEDFGRTPHSGSRFWLGGDDTGYSWAKQWVDVSAYADFIDAGSVQVVLNAYVTSHGDGTDKTQLGIACYGSDGGTLADVPQGYQNHSTWTEVVHLVNVPPGTREREQGSNGGGCGEENGPAGVLHGVEDRLLSLPAREKPLLEEAEDVDGVPDGHSQRQQNGDDHHRIVYLDPEPPHSPEYPKNRTDRREQRGKHPPNRTQKQSEGDHRDQNG